MKKFLTKNFLLQTNIAKKLYHDFAKEMPIIDYHSHLPAQQIADDINFENLTQIWLNGDHYKWRAMRINGVDESYCTGDKDDYEKLKNTPITFRKVFALSEGKYKTDIVVVDFASGNRGIRAMKFQIPQSE